MMPTLYYMAHDPLRRSLSVNSSDPGTPGGNTSLWAGSVLQRKTKQWIHNSLWSMLTAFATVGCYHTNHTCWLFCGVVHHQKRQQCFAIVDAYYIRVWYSYMVTCPTIPKKTWPPQPGLYSSALRNSESLTTEQPQSTWRDAVYRPCASLDSYMAVHQPWIWPW